MLLISWRWVVAAGALSLAAAPAVGAAEHDKPVVVATTSIWADIVAAIDCTGSVEVETLIPVGGDAHSYEPSMRDRDVLGDASLVVANGGGLEALLDDTLDAVADDGTPVLRVVEHVDGGDDPHVWFDPMLVIEAAPTIAAALVDAGAAPETLDHCLTDYRTAVKELHGEVTETLSSVAPERRVLVTNHDSLGHLARRYNFTILGTVLPGESTLAEASPADIERLQEEIEAAGVPAIFAEALESSDEATTLGERLGVEVVTLFTDSLGEEGSGAESYADLMRFDAAAIAAAIAG